ncbi:hypothetical protein GMORB2_3320 [Geosmithia morbida]|uniref:Mediator of RNA polymerase II transcription subunit 5 n=1 Tax=Geosmithia morbida TaxID=1094350 RepID=A0A9P4YR63_9HYPO|nr:uncharacterized protein GMORB2_3320 [Geosmithia morbida]KAF4120193.1 hypothetical protein GMORB2_3320 [Geosmithia morbida]
MDGGKTKRAAALMLSARDRRLRQSVCFWSEFIERCINRRLDPDSFQSLVRVVHDEHPLPAPAIADLFLRPQPNCCYSLDPRVPPYLQVLSDLKYIDASATLRALYRYSSSHTLVEAQRRRSQQSDGHHKDPAGVAAASAADQTTTPVIRWRNSYWVEEVIFFRLCKSVHEGRAVQTTRTAFDVLKIVAKWLALFTEASSAFAHDLLNSEATGSSQTLQMEMETARAAFVPLLLRLTDNPVLLRVLAKPAAKHARRELSQNLAAFVPTLQLVNTGTEKSITEKLEFFRTRVLASLDPVDKKKKQAADAAMNEMLDSAVGPDAFEVAHVPIVTTRVGMYIHLNAVGDNQTAAIDLVLASFDVLANAIFRDGGKQDASLLRSFLINKVPLLLCQLLPPGFSTPSAEMCITSALNQVDRSLFPTASLMFDESRNNNPYTESVREDFCAACVLHGLINQEHVEAILGEMSMSYEPEKKSTEKLVNDYQAGNIRIVDLLGDLDKMDGNVAAVAHAVAEIIRRLCNEKDTASLKTLCTDMVQKLQCLDILLLFETLPSILGPLCQLLEGWHYEDDQAEYQPVYEEFGAILLLVLAFTNRYTLKPSDLGLYSPDSKLRKIITHSHTYRGKEQLSEAEDKCLNGWILGLFDTEAGGLGDELMSSCPPQEFYLLIAPLFYNIVVGYSHGYINDESLKSGVEYLVDTFLYPSLVPALLFLADYLKIDQKEQKAVIKVLQLILLPATISSEATAMLSSVKRIVAKPLANSLQMYLHKRDPKNVDVTPLLDSLKDSIPLSRRSGWADASEIAEWARAEPHGLWTSLRTTTQGLMQWSMQPQMTITPMTYTHRQFILGVKMMGPRRVLRLILEEVRRRHQDHSAKPNNVPAPSNVAGVVNDVATALICSPDVTNEPPAPSIDNAQSQAQQPQRLLTLRDMLKMEADKTPS